MLAEVFMEVIKLDSWMELRKTVAPGKCGKLLGERGLLGATGSGVQYIQMIQAPEEERTAAG